MRQCQRWRSLAASTDLVTRANMSVFGSKWTADLRFVTERINRGALMRG